MNATSRARVIDAIVTVAAIVAVSLSLHAVAGGLFPGDMATAERLQQTPGGRYFEPVADAIYLIPVQLVVLVTGFVLALRARDASLALAVVLVAVARIASPILKDAIDRPRPAAGELLIREPAHGSSFPSGHALTSMLVYGYAAYVALLHAPRQARRWMLVAAVTALLLVGWDRVWDGAHWPSDVYGGWAAGVLLLAASVWATNRAVRWLRG